MLVLSLPKRCLFSVPKMLHRRPVFKLKVSPPISLVNPITYCPAVVSRDWVQAFTPTLLDQEQFVQAPIPVHLEAKLGSGIDVQEMVDDHNVGEADNVMWM